MVLGEQTRKVSTLAVTGVGFFMVLLDITIVSVALPSIQRDLGATASGLSWVVNGYTLPFAVLLLTFGTLGDRFGRRKLFLAGIAIFTIGSLVCFLAPNLGVLIAGRAIQGIGGAAVSPTSLALIAAAFPEEKERTRAVGVWSAITGLSLAAGPLLGGVLIQWTGDWRTVFVVNLPLGAIAIVLGIFVLPETPTRTTGKLDILGQLLVIAALAPAIFALVQGNTLGWASSTVVACFTAAVNFLALFLWRQLRATNPMLPLPMFSNRLFTGSSIVTFVVGFALTSNGFFLSQYFQDIQGASALGSGLRTLPITVGIFAMASTAGRLAARYGYRVPVVIGSISAGSGLLLLAGIHPDMPYGDIWWRLIFVGAGFGLTLSPLVGAVLSSVPPARVGVASGVNNVARQIGGTLGVAVLTAIITSRFTSNLETQLTSQHIPDASTIAATLGQQGALAARGTEAIGQLSSEKISAIIATAFSDAFHIAATVNGSLLISGAIVAVVTLRRTSILTNPTNRKAPQ